MTTQEIKGKRRFGRGRQYRLVGPYAVGVGQWSLRSEAETQEWYRQMAKLAERDAAEARLIDEGEFEELQRRFQEDQDQFDRDRIARGWQAPWWHYERWPWWLFRRAIKLRIVHIDEYGRRGWGSYVHWGTYTPKEETQWRPMQVAEDDVDGSA